MISQLLGTTIATITFISYVVFITIKYGMLPSISDSYYKHGSKLLFFLFMFGIGMPIILMSESGFMFFSGVYFILCGCSPNFKINNYSFEDELHKIGAIGGVLFMFLYFMSRNLLFPIGLFTFLLGVICIINPKNRIFWVEICAFVSIILGLYVK